MYLLEKLFPYLTTSGKTWITSRIGERLKEVVGGESFGREITWIEDPSVLNDFNREKMAKEIYAFYERTFREYLTEEDNFKCNIVLDLTKQIDRNILTRYAMLKNIEKGIDKDKAKRLLKNINPADYPEIRCHYDHYSPGCPLITDSSNHLNSYQPTQKSFIIYATVKQKKYLLSLIEETGYELINEDELTLDEATEIISFFLDDKPISQKTTQKHLQYE